MIMIMMSFRTVFELRRIMENDLKFLCTHRATVRYFSTVLSCLFNRADGWLLLLRQEHNAWFLQTA